MSQKESFKILMDEAKKTSEELKKAMMERVGPDGCLNLNREQTVQFFSWLELRYDNERKMDETVMNVLKIIV